jgi:hypothetical protein
MVPPASRGIARVPRYSGAVSRKVGNASLTGLSPSLVGLSRHLRLHSDLMTSRVSPETVPQPRAYFYDRFGLFRVRSPLLTESRLISLPAGTEMFHFPAFASDEPQRARPMIAHYHDRVSPFGHPRIKACLAAPRGFSQLATSFFAFSRQGIHRVLLVA